MIEKIETQADYDAALARIDVLMAEMAGTPHGKELDILLDLVGGYEDLHEGDEEPGEER